MRRDINFYTQYALVDEDFYEPLARQAGGGGAEFLRILRGVLPAAAKWRINAHAEWIHCAPPHLPDATDIARQGFKIHISCRLDNAEQILAEVAKVLLIYKVSFKCARSATVLDRMLLAKNVSRSASGKFITVYPPPAQFAELIQELAEALSGFEAPYILSDRRFAEDAPVYYRYGVFSGYPYLTVRGETRFGLRRPGSEEIVADERMPAWHLPDWAKDPFESHGSQAGADAAADASVSLGDGKKYIVDTALSHSNGGGVYLARTAGENARRVLIKEARPNVCVDRNGKDAMERLTAEHRMLLSLQDTDVPTPKPVALFNDQGHRFLVLDYISNSHSLAEISRPLPLARLLAIAEQLAFALSQLHALGIVFGDLSPGNVLLTPSHTPAKQGGVAFDERLTLIDFEAARVGEEAPTDLGTLGFTAPGSTEPDTFFKDDVYSFGSVLLWLVVPITNILQIRPDAPQVFLEEAVRSGGLPPALKNLVLRCMHRDDANARPDAAALHTVLQHIRARVEKEKEPSGSAAPRKGVGMQNHQDVAFSEDVDFSSEVSEMLRYLESTASYERRDRLFPADPGVFNTNPLSLAYGAGGVALALKAISGAVPEGIIAWMLSHDVSPEAYAPGMFTGIGGISCIFFALGADYADYASKLMHVALTHPSRKLPPGLLYGEAGLGIASLFAYKHTGSAVFLDAACAIAQRLLDSAQEDEASGGLCWISEEDGVPWTGLGEGSAGISYLFLLISLITGEEKWRKAGERALSHSISACREVEQDGERRLLMAPSPRHRTASTYLTGAAGLASVLVRWLASGSEDGSYRETLTRLFPPTPTPTQRWSAFVRGEVSPGLLYGLSGVGTTYLDIAELTGDVRYRATAARIAREVLLFGIEKEAGLAFPGEHLLRISTDLATGSAGIALFFSRFTQNAPRAVTLDFGVLSPR